MIYRINTYTESGEHYGYEYFGSRRKAEARIKELGEQTTIERATTPTDKQGVLALLNRWASHPDNG